MEDENKIFEIRSYQQDIFDVCIKKNTIIYLPTGSGKTHIAIMTIKHFANDLVKSIDEGGKRTVFIVNTVALANQQAEYLKHATNLIIGCYTGEMNLDNWNMKKWRSEINKHQVIVATCQVILDVILHGFVSIIDFNLLIFDECHHGRSDHPMHQLMELFEKLPKSDQPRVLGLSAVLILAKIKPKDVNAELCKLENVFQASITTVNSYDDYNNVMLYSTNPIEKFIYWRSDVISLDLENIVTMVKEFNEEISMKFEFFTNNYISPKTLRSTNAPPARFIKKLFEDFVYQLEDMGLIGACISILSIIVDIEVKKRESETVDIRQFYKSAITFAELISHMLEKKMKTLDPKKFQTDKVIKLICLLQRYFVSTVNKDDIKCLVFVKRRYTAKILYHVLKRNDPTLKVDFIVGSGNDMPESYTSLYHVKKNRQTLEDFRNNKLNVIINTNVLEEGIDLQLCNLVVMYDTPETFSSYFQTKGRARSATSQYIMLIPDKKAEKLKSTIVQFGLVESKVKTFLIGKTITRDLPDDNAIQKELYDSYIHPFFTKKDAKLTAVSSISVLYRYVQSLPRDMFTELALSWQRIDEKNLKTVVLYPPTQSRLRDSIISEPFENLRYSKRSASFKACVMLYEIGELSEYLIPIDSKTKIEQDCGFYFKHWENYKNDDKQTAGSRKHKRQYKIVYPKELTNCKPIVHQVCYLYCFKLTPQFSRNDVFGIQEVYHQLLDNSNSFGILTTKLLPKQLAKFPLFITIGEIEVEILTKPIKICISDDSSLQMLLNFHRMIFRDILRIQKNFVVHDNSNNENSYILVPTVNYSEINWSVVKEYRECPAAPNSPPSNKTPVHIDSRECLHKIVHSYHNNDIDINYLVTHVLENMNPLSVFPNNHFKNFKSYYEIKYGSVTTDLNQFLIQVSGITTALNFLNPGMDEESRHRKLDNRQYQIIFIPELCHTYKFPGDMWLKAKLLPSILHRLHFLLLAESIRRDLSENLSVECEDTPQLPLVDETFMNFDEDAAKYKLPQQQLNLNLLPNTINSQSQEHLTKQQIADDVCDIDRDIYEITPSRLDQYVLAKKSFKKRKLSVDKTKGQTQCIGNFEQMDTSSTNMNRINSEELQKKSKINLLNLDENSGLQQRDILKALTTCSSSDIFDQERFEVLGDSFLKFSVSLYVYKYHTDMHEGHLTTLKGKIVSNRNLFYCGDGFNLGGMIKMDPFQPKSNWLPPLFCLPEVVEERIMKNSISVVELHKLQLTQEQIENIHPRNMSLLQESLQTSANANTTQNNFLMLGSISGYFRQQMCGDKNVADTVEALLGVCVKTVGISKSFKFLTYLHILPENKDVGENQIVNLMDQQIPCLLINNGSEEKVDKLLINYELLEHKLGYKFRNKLYLLQALTHPSFKNNRTTECYQKLEFLGDAVLDFLITSYIFENCSTMDPGKLTDLRSALVNNTTLACISVRNGFHLHLLSNSATLSDTILKFTEFQEQMGHRITDQVYMLVTETDSLGRELGDMEKVSDFIDVPKALGDVLESLIGAIFLDSHNNLEVVWNVIFGLMQNEIQEFMVNVPIQIVRRLFEFPGAEPSFCKSTVSEDVVTVMLKFTCKHEIVSVLGVGQNKKNAQKDAAKQALRKLYAK